MEIQIVCFPLRIILFWFFGCFFLPSLSLPLFPLLPVSHSSLAWIIYWHFGEKKCQGHLTLSFSSYWSFLDTREKIWHFFFLCLFFNQKSQILSSSIWTCMFRFAARNSRVTSGSRLSVKLHLGLMGWDVCNGTRKNMVLCLVVFLYHERHHLSALISDAWPASKVLNESWFAV